MASEPMRTVGEIQAETRARLEAACADTAALDARLLVMHVLSIGHEVLIGYPDRLVASCDQRTILELTERRCAGEPISRIAGVREFYGRRFQITPATLDPRPDTETVVEAVLEAAGAIWPADTPLRVLDLGTGSGALLITLLAEWPQAQGVGTDFCQDALDVAQANAQAHGVASRCRFVRSDWLEEVEGRFDIIVSNPPYIRRADLDGLAVGVKDYDPRLALDGGPDGLDAYRLIAEGIGGFLSLGGFVTMEIGEDQAEQVAGIFQAVGLGMHDDLPWLRRDLAGRPRVVTLSANFIDKSAGLIKRDLETGLGKARFR